MENKIHAISDEMWDLGQGNCANNPSLLAHDFVGLVQNWADTLLYAYGGKINFLPSGQEAKSGRRNQGLTISARVLSH